MALGWKFSRPAWCFHCCWNLCVRSSFRHCWGHTCTSIRAWRNRSAAVRRIAKAFEAHRPTMRVLVPLIAFFGETLTAPMTIAAVRKRSMFWSRAIIHRILRCSLLMTVLAVAPACAEQGFDNVAGSWSGSGSMKPSDGARERVRCKVDYNIKNAGQSVKMNVRCASDAYKMDLSANIDQNGTALSGNWFESQYRQGGKVSGQNVNGLIEAKVESDTIIALLTVRTKGNHQTFVMEAPGAWVSQVSIDLVRDPR
jgi:hypothetical protein